MAEANLAPSVHNTQPTRWQLEADGSVLVLEDGKRRLPVGDPAGRDAAVSHGAVIEGFAMACAACGVVVTVQPCDGAADGRLRPVARLCLSAGASAEPLHQFVRERRTYRGTFVKSDDPSKLDALGVADDVRLVRSRQGVARLAQLNDEASLRTFRNGAFRAELLSWMRLSRSHPQWALDGLNAEAMEMSALEAAGAGLVLKPGIFEALDRLQVAPLFVAEKGVVCSAQAIALFHRSQTESPLETGRHFYRLWLAFTRQGLSAAPMAVLADDPETRAIIAREFDVPPGRRLITAFRLGIAPPRDITPKPRLSATALLA
ncbi:MAG TPA: hypothetical protein VHU87_15530 [Rhizomicrobium sp.]|nr:hypothetical protein [Rhizomicrobium sp.]